MKKPAERVPTRLQIHPVIGEKTVNALITGLTVTRSLMGFIVWQFLSDPCSNGELEP